MDVLLTGGGGFAMAVLAAVLRADSGIRLTLLDRSALTAEPGVRVIRADVRDRETLRQVLAEGFDVVVHGAALTHVPDWERSRPADYLDVNVMGTCAVLDTVLAGARPPRRLIYVSSCAVYGDGTPGMDPQPESGPLTPGELYGVSKAVAERVVARYGELFGLPYVTVRPAKLFGPMERPTGTRALMSAPFLLASALVRGRPLRVTERTMRASLDWLNAEDAAEALTLLVRGAGPNGATYNLGTGRRIPFRELLQIAETHATRAVVRVVPPDTAELDLDPDACLGRDAASAVDLAGRDLSWRPRPFQEQASSYFTWALRNPAVFG
ncbi:NAD(P)-dependent oxidoreductase [Microbispora hainanensis]|uniref:NAD(P)-dependent oxidoreductase n=1 Tax=Microbispora hainanensis TaxID=568844 RepID=A0ABZ1SHB1_9ACTN|nr:NAD(P)-dependent oxidoreductase [Microbispora hainanensis]